MKFSMLGASAAIVLLSACATVETQSAANTVLDATVTTDEAASENAGATVANAVEDQANDDRIVCKRTISTGTRLGAKRQCMSVREWRAMREASREIMREGQMRNLQTDVASGVVAVPGIAPQ